MAYPDPTKDSDIQVINRESTDYDENQNHGDLLDTPNFIQSLDLPTPTGSLLFEDLDQKQNYQQQPFEIKNEFENGEFKQNYEDNERSGPLTRFNNPLPPLAPLSDPVIPNLPSNPIVPEYISNSINSANRTQMMIGAGKKRKEQAGPKTRPAFVMKMWSMVNDPANHDYIRWNHDGETFQVFHREEFMKSILPKYFKHNNFASFVRQLNMYGWHKVQDINSGSMAKDERNLDEVLQFKNPFFTRGREDLLDKIVRNKTGTQDGDAGDNTVNFLLMMSELDQIKMNQLAIIEDMRRIRKDNQTLWNESFSTRERHLKQSQTLDKIMKFLAAVYGNNTAGKIFEVDNTPFELAYPNQVSTYNNPVKQNFQPPPQTNTAFPQPAPILKPRLMLMDQAYQKTPSVPPKSPSVSTGKDSTIEEIIRNGDDFGSIPSEPNSNVNKIYQQIMNHEPAISSPRHFFPELDSPYIGPSTPQNRANGPSQEAGDPLQGLEQNIYKQGQALLQVQDWIQTLADRQQQQQQQLQQQRSLGNLPNDLDDFDVNEFLNNSSNHLNTQDISSLDNTPANGKRHIEEVHDDDNGRPKRRARNQ